MRRLSAVVLLAAGTASADPPDDVAATGELGPVRVAARLAGTVVRIDAQFDLTASGPNPAPGESHSFLIPPRAVITGATAHEGGRSHRLQLLPRADADKKLEALDEMPGRAGGRLTAIRLDASEASATATIAVPRHAVIRLDVTLEVPACYANDARHIIVPPTWADRMDGFATRLTGAAAEEIDERCDETSSGNARFAFTASALAKRPSGEPRIGIHSARLSLATKRDVARIEISLAKQLSDIPRDLYTVFVVDHSRSVTADEHEIQRAVIAGYLRAAPRARVQLVGYTRDARTQLAGWMLASQAGARIDRHTRALAPRNGSNVDVGLATAANLLANVTGTHRVVLFTDGRLADHLTEEVTQQALAAGLAPGTIVHVVGLGGSGPGLVRHDAHVLAPLAKATTGIATLADVDDQGQLDALALVRPISLDNITFEAPGWNPLFEGPQCDVELIEGSSCVFLGDGQSTTGPIHVEADLWNLKVTRDIAPDARGARSLARLLSTASGLPNELVDPIRNAAVAVNDAWSLLAIWGPRGGYADQESLGTFGFGRIGTIGSHSGSHDHGTGTRAQNPGEEVENQLGPAVRRCKPRGSISTTVELTREEIVRVVVRLRDKRDAAVVDCITEGIWDTMLSLAEPPGHATVTVDFQP